MPVTEARGLDAAQAEPFDARWIGSASRLFLSAEDEPPKPLTDGVLVPISSSAGRATFFVRREPRKQWLERADLYRAELVGRVDVEPVRRQVAQPSVRAPRRGHVGRRRRPAPRRARASSSNSSRGDPDQGDEPWALSFVDRAPFLWRVRHLRCLLLEVREGVDR